VSAYDYEINKWEAKGRPIGIPRADEILGDPNVPKRIIQIACAKNPWRHFYKMPTIFSKTIQTGERVYLCVGLRGF
jgi:hypothetical protein